MAEQRWRNPRSAPQEHEIRRHLGVNRRLPRLLRDWWPALLWACMIFSFSTDSFSSAHTESILYPIFHWLIPSLTPEQFEPLHHLIRKSAHFTEYFVFCVLIFRGVRSGRAGWRWTWALTALSTAAVYACLDEFHQVFVPSRTASPWDSLLDTIGAAAASAVIWMWIRARTPAVPGTQLPQGES